MKIFGRSIPKGSILLFISFTAISLCLMLIISSVRAENDNRLNINGLYSENSNSFYVDACDDKRQWDKVIPKLCAEHDDFSVCLKVPHQEITVRGVYINGDIDVPPMVEGRYFDTDTSWTDTPMAVLGKEFKSDVFLRNDRMYYSLGGIEYEVIGIMGTRYDSRMNSMIMIDFKSAVKITGVNTSYVLDAKSRDAIKEIGGHISDIFSSGFVAISLVEEVEMPLLMRLLSSDAVMGTMYVMILLNFLLSTVLVTFIWLRFRRQLLFAWHLCGYERKYEILEISKRYFIWAGIGFAAGLIITSFISGMMQDIYIAVTDVLTALAVTVGFGAVIMLCCFAVSGKKLMLK